MTVLAVADVASRESVTFENPKPETLLQAGVLVLLLGLVVLLVASRGPIRWGLSVSAR